MKRTLGITKKLIISSLMLAMIIPSAKTYGATYNQVVRGGAAIGRNSDGSLSFEAENLSGSSSDELNDGNNDTGYDLSGTAMDGIFIGDIDISGLTYDQIEQKIKEYVSGLYDGQITLQSFDDKEVTVSAKELGLTWNDKETVSEALSVGKNENIVQRYKTRKDIQHDKKVYDLNLICDYETVKSLVEDQAQQYDIEAVNGTIKRENGEFKVTQGTSGRTIDIESSVKKIEEEMASYDGKDKVIQLDVVESNPQEYDLSKVTDLLGSFTTSFSSSGSDRSGNVRNGTNLVNGTVLLPGEQFSMYKTVSPFTEENGYYMAGSYLNGMVVESLGGGICQVSSTLYNAVIRAELQVDERYNHSMIVTYVEMSSDAAISGTSKDFKFTNSTDNPIYIEGYTTDDKQIVFNIYGVETRPANRTIEFESVELSKTELEEEKIVTDSSQPLGYISTQSAHTGYTGELYKIVKVDGVETDRIRLNKSNYQASPRTATVGTATDNPAALAALQTAIATGSIDYVKSTISSLNAAAAAAVTAVGNI